MIFPRLGVRLISVNDNYDAAAGRGGITLPLINLLNEAYALDISLKTRSQARQAMKDGVYVGGRTPYGYNKSPGDRRKLIVDAPAADIVRQIFEWAANEINIHEIARRLNTLKISSPGIYGRGQDNERSETSGLWYARTVERILDNEIYLGQLVQGKTKVVNFRRQSASSNEWVRAYDTHAAIVSPEVFQTVQTFRQKTHKKSECKSTSPYSPNIFKRKIYCAHCGGHMERKKNHQKYIYRCIANRIAPGSCEGNCISEDAARQALLEQLLQYKEIIDGDLNAPSIEPDPLPELCFIEMELFYMQDITRTLYENLVTGILDQKEYSHRT